NLPADLPAQTPIEVRFRYEENGRLTVNVQVEGTHKQLQHEITRENSLTQDQLDSWRKYSSGLEPAAQTKITSLPPPAPRPTVQAGKPAAAMAKPTAAMAKPVASPSIAASKPKPNNKSADLDAIAAAALDDDDEGAADDTDFRDDFIRTRYAEE